MQLTLVVTYLVACCTARFICAYHPAGLKCTLALNLMVQPSATGVRVLKGVVASSLPLGLGVAVESAVAPAGVEGAITEMTRSSTEDVKAAKVR